MKLRDKHCHADFFAYYPHSELAYETPPAAHILSPYQYSKYIVRPWLITQYAEYLAELMTVDNARPEIYGYVSITDI